MGCNSNGEALRIGNYNEQGGVTFQKEEIKKQETINDIKSLLNPKEAVETSSPDDMPSIVIQINNNKKSTMVLNVSLWTEDSPIPSFFRGHLNDKNKLYYELSEKNWLRIKELIDL